MLTQVFRCSIAALIALGIAGCASDESTDTANHRSAARTTHREKKSDDDDDHDMSKPPHVGMTKSQVRTAYGEPQSRDVTDSGEEWTYRLNLGDAMVAGLNPFDFGAHGRLRFGQVYFGSDGRVKRFHWDTGHSDD